MLDGFRKHSNSIVVKALLFLLIASFAAWGVGDMLRPAATGSSVATVGGEEISAQEVFNDFQREMARMRQLTGEQGVNDQLAQAVGNSVVDRAINRALLAAGADEMDVAVSDEMVAKFIREDEMFQDEGKFSRARFEQVMFSNQLNENQFIEMVRGDMVRNQVISVLANGTTLPESVAKDLYKHRQEKRSADVVVVSKDGVGEVPAPTEDEVKKYYDDNLANFMAPEYRQLSLLHITPTDIAKNIEVPLKKIEDSFAERQGEFEKEETRVVEQMVFTTKEEATAAINMIVEGKSFEQIAQETLGLDKDAILLGEVKKDELPEELQDPVFNLVMRGIDGPIETGLGWHLINVAEINKGKKADFAEVKDKLRDDLALEMAGEELFGISNDIEDALGGGATIEEAAKTAGFDMISIASTDKTAVDADGKGVEALINQQAILDEAFAIDMTAEPSMKDDGFGGYFMVRVDGITETKARPFENVKPAVEAFVQDIKRFDAAKAKANAILAKVKGGAALAAAAEEEASLSITQEKNFTRTDAPLPRDVVTALFAAKVGEAASGVTQEGHMVAVLSEIKSTENADDQAAVNALRTEMMNGVSTDLQGQFVNALRSRIAIKIDRAMVNQLFTQEQR